MNPVKEARVSDQALTKRFPRRSVWCRGPGPRVTYGYLTDLGLSGGGVGDDAVADERPIGLDRHVSIVHTGDTARGRYQHRACVGRQRGQRARVASLRAEPGCEEC